MNFLKKGLHLFKGVFLLILLVFLVWYVLFALQESDMSAQGTLVEHSRDAMEADCDPGEWTSWSVCAGRPEGERQVCL